VRLSQVWVKRINIGLVGAAIGLERTAGLATCEASFLKRGKYKLLIYLEISWFVILVCGDW
jgi:hypothetical protein